MDLPASLPVLVSLLEPAAVPWATLEERYGGVLALPELLLGVVPNCDPYLEIWPPAFRAYNLLVPSLLNLPPMIFGLGAPRATIGLAMYVASRSAGCAYCSAHSCTFALRRGATVGQVAAALDGVELSEADRAAVAVARGASTLPVDLTDAERAALREHFSEADAEWVVLATSLMGWLNKAMDALGVPLEDPVVAEVASVIEQTGWEPGKHHSGAGQRGAPPRADSLGKRLGVIRHAPAALRYENEATRGVPDRWPAVGVFLQEAVGHDFPLLSRLKHRRAIRALATVIRDTFPADNLDPADKLAAGLAFAQAVQNEGLAAMLRGLGAEEGRDTPGVALARAVAPSPVAVDARVLEEAAELPPEAIVELVAFVALLQLLHRLGSCQGV